MLKEVRQECILSPAVFNLYSEAVFQKALEEIDKRIKVNGKRINNIRYADDTVLADNLENRQLLMDKINEKSKNFGLRMNIHKTKILVVSKNKIDNVVITLDGLRACRDEVAPSGREVARNADDGKAKKSCVLQPHIPKQQV